VRLEQLEYLTAVTRHGSLRRAGEHLHVSQPALSESLTKLERELGVQLLERARSGARISRAGQDLLPHMTEVLEAVDRLREAAGDHGAGARDVRLGSVGAATSTVVVPAVEEVHRAHPGTRVELVTLRQTEIDDGLVRGSLDLGLVNVLDGDETPADCVEVSLLRGRPVVVLPAGHPLARTASEARLDAECLRAERFVAMRPGYVMHRVAGRLFGDRPPEVCHSTDGAEMGKALVAEGLGVTVLPDFSVEGDPLHRAGLVTTRPLAGDVPDVTLVLRRRRSSGAARPVQALYDALVAGAAAVTTVGTSAPDPRWSSHASPRRA